MSSVISKDKITTENMDEVMNTVVMTEEYLYGKLKKNL
jgi:hypothetical protein